MVVNLNRTAVAGGSIRPEHSAIKLVRLVLRIACIAQADCAAVALLFYSRFGGVAGELGIDDAEVAIIADGNRAAVRAGVVSGLALIFDHIAGEYGRLVEAAVDGESGGIIHQDRAAPDIVFVGALLGGFQLEALDLSVVQDGQGAAIRNMNRPAVVCLILVLAIEPYVLQGHVRAVGKRDQRARVDIPGSILTVGGPDQRTGGIRGTGGAEDIPVLRRTCFGGGKGDGSVAVIAHRR